MKYRSPVETYPPVPKKGDVWALITNEFGECHRTRAVITSVSTNKVTFRRLTHECTGPDCHLLSDPASAGLDYAEYMNNVPESAHFNGLVKKIGRLSRVDRAFI